MRGRLPILRCRTCRLTALLSLFCLAGRADEYEISIRDYAYDPPNLAIKVGDTVTWRVDEGEHTATSDDGVFDSDVLDFGQEFSFTFSEAGAFPYHCSIHTGLMSGLIVASDAGENESPYTPVNQSPADNATNQPVAVQLVASAFSDPDGIDFHAASQWLLRYASNNVVALDSGEVTGAGNLTNYSPVGLSEGTIYSWQVRYKDGRGAWSEYSSPTRFTTLVSFSGQGSGLLGSYNNVANFAAPLVVTTNEVVDFNWGNVRPHRRITADDFAVRWEGSLLPRYTEQYQIQFQYHGRARVWVNDQLLIDEWNGCSFKQTRRGAIPLVAGQLAAVRVDYVADATGAQAALRWTSPSQPLEVIPTARLFPHAP